MMRRDRRGLAATAVLVVAVGAALRFGVPGVAGDVLGGLCYAVLVFVLLALAVPGARTRTLGIVAAGWCLGVELLQLTGFPAAIGREFPPARLVLGSGFTVLDLLTAATGVLAAVVVDRAVARRAVRNTAARRS